MAYKLTKAEMSDINKESGFSLDKNIMPSRGDLDKVRSRSGLPKEGVGGLESFAAGVANPLIALANLAPEALSKLVHKDVPEIPYVPHSGGLPHTLGEIAGFALPFGGAAKGVGLAARGAAKLIPALERVPGLLRGLGRSAAAGGLSGFAGTPQSEGRESGAAGGALGGVAGEAAGRVLSSALRPIRNIGKFLKTKEGFLKGSNINYPENAQSDLINDSLGHYNNAVKNSSENYRKVWEKSGKEGIPLAEMKNVNSLIEKEKNKFGNPFYDTEDFEDFPRTETGNISPEDLHFKKSEAFRKSKTGLDTTSDKIRHKKYYQAMKSDLEDHLKRSGSLDAYNQAATEWKKNLLPFKNSKAFSKIFKDVEMVHPEVEGQDLSASKIASLSDSAKSSNLANQFLPTGRESDIGKFKDLQNLLGGSKKETSSHLKNMMLSKFVDDNGDMNFEGLLNYVEGKKGSAKKGLSKSQKEYIFSPQELKTFKESASLVGKTPKTDGRLFKIISAIMGGHIHPGIGHIVGYESPEIAQKALMRIPLGKGGEPSALPLLGSTGGIMLGQNNSTE